MTQNLTSSALSTDKPDYEKQSSSEIRAGIDETRASVGDKIDQLQARLDPNRLKQQAQETVQEMLNDTAGSMTDYVKVHKDEMVTSLADAARRNPLPTALVGLGIGWLILESMAGPREERRRPSTSHDYQPYDDRGERAYRQGRVPSMEPNYYPPQSDESYYASSDWSRSPYASRSQNRSDYDQSYYDPAFNPTSGQDFSRGYGQVSSQGYDPNDSQGYNQEARQEARPTYGNGHHQGENPLSKAAGAVKDSVGDMTGRVSDVAGDVKARASDVAGDVKDRVSDTASDMKERVSDTINDMGNRVSNAAGDVRDRFNDTMGDVRHQGQRQYNRATQQMDQWQHQARHVGERRGRQVVNHLEDNPLIYGAVAMAAGAALALLLPQSRVENRAFGEMRDQVMAKGQEVLDTAKGHAQQVFEDVRPDLEQTARQIVSDVTESGKQAAKGAAEQLSPIVDKALTKGKEEARSAAQEVGVDPDKLTAGKPSTQASALESTTFQPAKSHSSSANMAGASSSLSSSTDAAQGKAPLLNRDTLSGQWQQVKGEVKRRWGQLTDDDITRIAGDYDKLIGAIQTRYGYTREQVERELNDFFNSQRA